MKIHFNEATFQSDVSRSKQFLFSRFDPFEFSVKRLAVLMMYSYNKGTKMK